MVDQPSESSCRFTILVAVNNFNAFSSWQVVAMLFSLGCNALRWYHHRPSKPCEMDRTIDRPYFCFRRLDTKATVALAKVGHKHTL